MEGRLFSSNKLGLIVGTLSVLFTFILISGRYGVSHASDLSLIYKSGKLSANVSGASLQKVLETLSAKCGMNVFLDSSLKSKKIFSEFEDLPLEKGIKRLVNPYSSAMIFGKRASTEGRSEFFITELKVFGSSNNKAPYVLMGEKTSLQTEKVSRPSILKEEDQKIEETKKMVMPVPEKKKDPMTAATFNKEVRYSVLRTRISKKITEVRQLQERMLYDERHKRNEIQQLQQQLKIASGSESKRIQASISALTADLENSRARNADEQKRLQRELDQLQRKTTL